MKKTLEEAAKKEYPLIGVATMSDESYNEEQRIAQRCFIRGANYQKSITPFSEEDMIGFAEWLLKEKTSEYLSGEYQGEMKEILKEYLKNKNKNK